MSRLSNFLSLVKFSHTIFAMPFAFIGFFLGFLQTDLLRYNLLGDQSQAYVHITDFEIIKRFLLVICCMVFARSAAMAFNRYLDREFDARNPRTAIREIPSGIIKANSALWFTIICCAIFTVCTWFINPLCFYLSPVALLVVLGYSYTKRFTMLCHLVLGLGLSLAPIGAYLAVTGRFDWLPVIFAFVVLCWVSGFDIIYSLQDEEFDKSQKLHSIPVTFGKKGALNVSRILHCIAGSLVIIAGVYGQFGLWYWIGVSGFIGMLVYQHSIVKPDDLKRVNIAFMTANGIASVFFALFVIGDLFFS